LFARASTGVEGVDIMSVCIRLESSRDKMDVQSFAVKEKIRVSNTMMLKEQIGTITEMKYLLEVLLVVECVTDCVPVKGEQRSHLNSRYTPPMR
jgi:hypothetical protein